MSFLTFIFILVFKVHIFKKIYLSVFGCDGWVFVAVPADFL